MLKKNIRICTNCVMDTTDPDITFDENGLCSHCRKFHNIIKPSWDSCGKIDLDEIINNIIIKKNDVKYDCIIGLSGGVDSSYLAYFLRTEYPKLKILAVHIDAGWNSELAVHNIENIVKKLNIDLYTKVIDWEEMKDLQLSYFKSQLANQDVPQDHVFFSELYEIAVKNNIHYFLNGGNYATESILPSSWGYDAKDGKQLKAIHKIFGKRKLKTYRVLTFFKRYFYYPYIKKLNIIRPLNYIYYNKEEAKKIIIEELDWKDYGGKHHESGFTKFFQAYWLPTKFGYDKRKAHLSSLILAGQLHRDEALEELKKPSYILEELSEDMEYIAKKLDIIVEEFHRIMKQPNKTYLDYPSEVNLLKFFRWLKKSFK